MRLLPSVVTLALALLAAAPAVALPRFAARESLRCRQCHVNPTGGGVRNRYGAEVYAAENLTLFAERPSEPQDYAAARAAFDRLVDRLRGARA